MIIRTLAKLIALLNSNRRPGEIGAALALGLWLAILPSTNLLFVAMLLIVFLVKVNLGMALVSSLLFSLLTPLLDPLLMRVGVRVLLSPGLQSFFARMSALPVVPWTAFNDTLVMGALVGGALLFLPVFLAGIALVRIYRKHVHAKIAQSKLVKAFMATPFAQRLSGALRGVRRAWPASA